MQSFGICGGVYSGYLVTQSRWKSSFQIRQIVDFCKLHYSWLFKPTNCIVLGAVNYSERLPYKMYASAYLFQLGLGNTMLSACVTLCFCNGFIQNIFTYLYIFDNMRYSNFVFRKFAHLYCGMLSLTCVKIAT